MAFIEEPWSTNDLIKVMKIEYCIKNMEKIVISIKNLAKDKALTKRSHDEKIKFFLSDLAETC